MNKSVLLSQGTQNSVKVKKKKKTNNENKLKLNLQQKIGVLELFLSCFEASGQAITGKKIFLKILSN